MNRRPFLIEEWFRRYDFQVEITLCSSGVEPYSVGEMRQLLSLSQDELDQIKLRDSYSYGQPALRKAIAEYCGISDPNHVLATHGSSEAIDHVMHTLLEEGDEVVALMPSYQSLYSLAQDLGCQVTPWSLRFDRGFVPDMAEVKALLTPQTRALIVNFPNSPTGVTLTRVGFDQLVETVVSSGAYLIWDGAFAQLTYDSEPLPDPHQYYDRVISFGTLSKAYGLPGLRLGWCIAPHDIIERCVSRRDYVTLSLNPWVEYVAQRVLEQGEHLRRPRLEQARTNLSILAEWVGQHTGMVEWVRPQGGVSVFLRLCNFADDQAFCHRLARDYRGLCLTGHLFRVCRFHAAWIWRTNGTTDGRTCPPFKVT